MGKKIDLTGRRFGLLVVAQEVGRNKCGAIMWECQCDCGNKTTACGSDLRNSHTTSCGCYMRQAAKIANTKHGFYYHPIYPVWKYMLYRCYNPKYSGYKNYGGRGIVVCDEWRNDPVKFIMWAEQNGWKKELDIDRYDNNGGYCPDNCRFVTRSKNILNTRLLNVKNTTGFRGACYDKHAKKYKAGIQIDGKQHYIGSFPTAIEAAKARDAFVIKNNIHTPLNFQQDKS